MNKLPLFFLAFSLPFFGFEKLDSKYLIQYGNPDAACQVIEYFSLSCPKCLEFFKNEFPAIKEQYIESGQVSWAFHPDPADLLTLQAMICIDRLPPHHKALFLEAVMDHMKASKQGCPLMKAAMEVFKAPLPELDDLEFIKNSNAFQDAYGFVTQKDVVTIIPSLEIDGHLYKEPPSHALLDAHIQNQKRSS